MPSDADRLAREFRALHNADRRFVIPNPAEAMLAEGRFDFGEAGPSFARFNELLETT